MHVAHPALRPETVTFRGYQANLARICGDRDTLVVLPTGMGKTIIATLALADALRDGAKDVLILAPTKPLVEQHVASLQRLLADRYAERVQGLTGHVAPKRREETYGEGGILVATPQVIGNDVVAGRLDIGRFDWVVFDEAHRAVGDYPYAFLGQEIQKKSPGTRRMGLTASPGHDVRKIDEVRHNLGLRHVEIRTPDDPDVAPFVQDVDMEWETLPLPEGAARASKQLTAAFAKRVQALKQAGVLTGGKRRPNRLDLLDVAKRVQAQLKSRPDPPSELYNALSLQAQAMKLLHAIELVETQGCPAFVAFIHKLREEVRGPRPSKASRSLAADEEVTKAYQIARHDNKENPKVGRTSVLAAETFERNPDARVIVFAHYRQTCEELAQQLAAIEGLRPVVFVGQGKRKGQGGLSQKEQAQILEAFRAGEHNTLVATSVAEEGLDIPQTDLVVFYEPIPSEIRSIQRRGRTGREREGRVVVLMTKGTQDEAAHWSARHKEQQMVQELHALRGRIQPDRPAAQRTLEETARPPEPPRPTIPAERPAKPGQQASGPLVVCDHREQNGPVARNLHQMEARVEMRQLDVGDYVLSDRVAVERKECKDFVDSLVDGRLMEQLRALKVYDKALLILEGDTLHGHRNVSVEALYGAIASITVDFGIPVVQTRDAMETARFLVAVAKREQGRENRKVAIRPGRQIMDDRERTLWIISGFPGISSTLAERLLEHFGTLRAVINADAEALQQVEGIGAKTAAEMQRLLDRPLLRLATETV